MAENMNLIYALVAVAVLGLALLFVKFRTSYIKSLYDKINNQEHQLGKTINQLAAAKTITRNLEDTIKSQTKQMEDMIQVNSGHSDKLSQSYLDNKKLIEDLKEANKQKAELEDALARIDIEHQVELEAKTETLDRIESSYKKVSHSFEILQKSNDNLREERDFYREEFMKLREGPATSASVSKVSHAKSA